MRRQRKQRILNFFTPGLVLWYLFVAFVFIAICGLG